MTALHNPTVNLIDVPGQLGDSTEELGVALGQWAMRDTANDGAAARRAANTAMDTIDAMLAGLHRARQALMDEMRQADDATAARVDAMLAGR